MAFNVHEAAAVATRCGCFRRFFGGRDEEESRSYLLGDREYSYVVTKLRELSEMNKWKKLIRKIFKNPRIDNKKSGMQFQYSPESYALNFAGEDHEDDAYLLHTRFAPAFFINDHPAM